MRNQKLQGTAYDKRCQCTIYNRSDLISQKQQTARLILKKDIQRHQHDKNRQNKIATVDSCFVLIGTRQHCVNYSRCLKRTEFSNQIFVSLGDSKNWDSTELILPRFILPATCSPNKSLIMRNIGMWDSCSLPTLVVDITLQLHVILQVIGCIKSIYEFSSFKLRDMQKLLNSLDNQEVFKRIRKKLVLAYSVF